MSKSSHKKTRLKRRIDAPEPAPELSRAEEAVGLAIDVSRAPRRLRRPRRVHGVCCPPSALSRRGDASRH